MPADAFESRRRVGIGLRDALLTVAVTVGLSLGIIAISGSRSLAVALGQGQHWPLQLLWGAALGALLGGPLITVVSRVPWFAAFHRQMIDLVSCVDLRGFNPLWFGLCAGVGEESLFRGALQPLAGPWTTSLIFTAVHYRTGGFRTMNRWKALYALMIFAVSLGLGAECVRIGLIAAIVTHTVVDVISLTTLRTVADAPGAL